MKQMRIAKTIYTDTEKPLREIVTQKEQLQGVIYGPIYVNTNE